MAKSKIAEIGYRCGYCGEFLQVKEGKTAGAVKDCKGCGEETVYRNIFIPKVEEDIPAEEKDKV